MQIAAQLAMALGPFFADDSGMSLMEMTLVGLLIAIICILLLLALTGAT